MLLRRLGRCNSGSTAAEFALTLPLLLIFILGIIDAGRLAWEYNRTEKATQVGARVAVVTNSFPSGLVSEDYVSKVVGGVTLTQGDRIPATALGDLKCTRTTCTCATAPCPSTVGTIDTTTRINALISANNRKLQALEMD